ncbi:TIGR03085 family metal-binding protein [Mycolicibacterium thermoresistibile]
MTAAQKERAALVETLRAVGPDAPTLCGDWTTRDLAAHLVIRERRPDAAMGILAGPLSGYTAKVQDQVAKTEWNELVDKIASGPPLLSVFKVLDPLVNVTEMFIHHEDVRRAGPDWDIRDLDDDVTAALRRPIGLMAKMTLGKAPARVSLQTSDGATLATVGSGPEVTVNGDPGELLLFVSGRDAARVAFSGDDESFAAVRRSRRGL